jgi:two-component system LytT family response regulator
MALVNCLIVDDQEVFRTILKKMVSLDSSLLLVGECKDAIEAHHIIQRQHIDILFLDIEMPEMDGIELAKALDGKRPVIIFISSVGGYAAEAFELNAADFLVKPITSVRFLAAVEKAKKILDTKDPSPWDKDNQYLFIRSANSIIRLKLSDVLLFEAKGDYIKIYLTDKSYSIRSSLKSIEDKLLADLFIKVHRSFVVNISKIDTIEGGTLIINHNMVPVSNVYRADLYKRVQIL